MRIRPAAPTDAGAIHRVSVASCRAAYESVLEEEAFLDLVDDPSRIDTLRAYLEKTTSVDPVIYLVAEQDSAIVGFLQLLYYDRVPDHIDDDDAYLKSLYVHPTSWNEGIGSTLLEEGLNRLPDELACVQVGVLTANDIGEKFYKKHDFERIDSGTFDVGAVTYETDIYAKPL